MNLLRILRFSPLVGALVLLLVGCGAHANSSGTGPVSPLTQGTGGTSSPSTEGTGPELPQSPANGGVSVSVVGLPIGQGPERFNHGNDECIQISPGAVSPRGRSDSNRGDDPRWYVHGGRPSRY